MFMRKKTFSGNSASIVSKDAWVIPLETYVSVEFVHLLQPNEDSLLLQKSNEVVRRQIEDGQSGKAPPQWRVLGYDAQHGGFQ